MIAKTSPRDLSVLHEALIHNWYPEYQNPYLCHYTGMDRVCTSVASVHELLAHFTDINRPPQRQSSISSPPQRLDEVNSPLPSLLYHCISAPRKTLSGPSEHQGYSSRLPRLTRFGPHPGYCPQSYDLLRPGEKRIKRRFL